MTALIFVVEDDPPLRQLLSDELEDQGYQVQAFGQAEDALGALDQAERQPDLIISDMRLPGMDGMALLAEVAARPDAPGFLIVTAFGSVNQAVSALKAGADDFLTKPLDLDHLRLTIGRLLEARSLRAQVQAYRQLIDDGHYGGMLGRSAPMRSLFSQIQQIAGTEAPALIVGESGTGKELIARALHSEGPRVSGPFLAVNCAGIPQELMESELFGHEAGAFTGARGRQQGLFQAASGGTLLLDEIGEMPLAMQAKLLRVLQEGAVRPVGATREVEVDVRVLAATNRDLEAEVKAGQFREDLFFRLETFTLRAPPLRDREDDLEYLALTFLRLHADQLDKPLQGYSDEALAALQDYPFPGNVRELQNAVERAVTFSGGPLIELKDLPPRIREHQPGASAMRSAERSRKQPLADGGDTDTGRPVAGDDGEASELDRTLGVLAQGPVLPSLAELEQRYIRYVLDQVDGNKRRAAALLGIGRRTLYRKLGLGEEADA